MFCERQETSLAAAVQTETFPDTIFFSHATAWQDEEQDQLKSGRHQYDIAVKENREPLPWVRRDVFCIEPVGGA